MKYQRFIFRNYEFDKTSRKLHLYYGFDGMLDFTETYFFDFNLPLTYDEIALDRAFQMLFFMAGISYYKAYLAPEISIEVGEIDNLIADFLNKTYQRGLGEFFYVNDLDPLTPIKFPINSERLATVSNKDSQPGLLVGIGGGKDSLVSTEILRRNKQNIATWSVGHRAQLSPLIKEIGLDHYWVERTWDHSLLEHNSSGAYNGHVPISALYACVGTIVSILSKFQSVVVSNEQSANDPTLSYRGIDINHQYSKSLEFENDYQDLLKHLYGSDLEYFSFLRPLTEVRISELFARIGFDKYKDTFSSCNRAFTHKSNHMFWCGECSKCAFTFLAMTPFIKRQKLEKLWRGKNLLLEANLETTYKKLLGIEGDKPLDCVGEVKESRAAMRLAQIQYPELKKYQFELPNDYNYKSLSQHLMPAHIYQQLQKALSDF